MQEQREVPIGFPPVLRLPFPPGFRVLGLLSLYPPYQKGDIGEMVHPRLAVLAGKLMILRPKAGGFVPVFSLEQPQDEEWDTLESFPSHYFHPGVIIRGEPVYSDYSGVLTIAVCYVGGKFRVVFKGYEAGFLHVSGADMPEAFSTDAPDSDYYVPTRERVWTWNGQRYRPVMYISTKGSIFSPELVRAIRAVRHSERHVERGKPAPNKPKR